MREVASKTRQGGMSRAPAVAFSVMVAVTLLLAMAPAASAYSPPEAPVITAPSEGSYDSDGNFTLSGTAPPNTTVKVFEVRPNDFRLDWVGTAQVDPYGRWHVKLGGVVVGRHSYKARVTDQMSIYSDWSAIHTVSVDPLRLLQPPDTLVRQVKYDTEQLAKEAQQQNLSRAVQDYITQLEGTVLALEKHSDFVATMPVGGITSTEWQQATDGGMDMHELLAHLASIQRELTAVELDTQSQELANAADRKRQEAEEAQRKLEEHQKSLSSGSPALNL